MNVVPLRDRPTQAQMRRAEIEMRKSGSLPDNSLCHDLSSLLDKIEAAALLAGARRPSQDSELMDDKFNSLDWLFLKLYSDAQSIILRAFKDYPGTKRLPRRRPAGGRKRRNPQLPLL